MSVNDNENILFIHDLYEKYKQNLWGYAYALSKDKDISDDIVQTVFLQLLNNVKTLQKIEKPYQLKAYLNTCIRNAFYSHKNYEKRFLLDDIENIPLATPVDEVMEEKIDQKYFITEVLAILTPQERDIITLRYYIDLPIKEVAETMNLSLSNTKRILYSAQNKIKRQFTDGGY